RGFVVGGELRQRAVGVPFRDPRFVETLAADVVPPAVAPHHATNAVLFNRLPARIVAERTRHATGLYRGRGPEDRLRGFFLRDLGGHRRAVAGRRPDEIGRR